MLVDVCDGSGLPWMHASMNKKVRGHAFLDIMAIYLIYSGLSSGTISVSSIANRFKVTLSFSFSS